MGKIIFLNIRKTIIGSLWLAVGLPLMAADSGQINYQARLLDSYGRRVNDTVDLSFKIYDAVTNGNLLWSETQTNIVVQDGVYSVVLGSQTAIAASVFSQNAAYLELEVNGETMTPRPRILATAYSLVARTVMGSNIFENQTLGYVGVGTTNPATKLDVNGMIQATGFKMPTGATASYVLVTDEEGVGSWRALSYVLDEHDPIFTNWVQVTFIPTTNALNTRAGNLEAATNALNTAINAETGARIGADAALSNSVNALNTATGALNTAVGTKLNRAGDVMTGPLTNNSGFFGNGVGLTNVPSSGVILTGYVQRIGGSMTGPLIVSNNVTITLTNQAGFFLATNSISLGGVTISNWNSVAGNDRNLTNDLNNLQAATNTLNTSTNALDTRAGNLETATTNLNVATNALNTRVNIMWTGKTDQINFVPVSNNVSVMWTGKTDQINFAPVSNDVSVMWTGKTDQINFAPVSNAVNTLNTWKLTGINTNIPIVANLFTNQAGAIVIQTGTVYVTDGLVTNVVISTWFTNPYAP